MTLSSFRKSRRETLVLFINENRSFTFFWQLGILCRLFDLQIFQRSSSRREHRHFNLSLRQLHHLHGALRGDGRGFEELTCHAAKRRARAMHLAMSSPSLSPPLAKTVISGAAFFTFRIEFGGWDSPADKGGGEFDG